MWHTVEVEGVGAEELRVNFGVSNDDVRLLRLCYLAQLGVEMEDLGRKREGTGVGTIWLSGCCFQRQIMPHRLPRASVRLGQS